MPETKTVRVSPQQLADQAKARANDLVSVATSLAGLHLTESDRKVVRLGIDLGVSAYMAVLEAQAAEGDHDAGHQ